MVPVVKNLSARQETQEMWVPSLGSEDPLEEEMAPHCSILAWEIPRTEEPGGLVHGVAKSRARQSIEAGPHTGSKMKSARALACRGPGPGRRPPSRLLSSPRTWRCSRRCCKKQAPPAPLLRGTLSSTPPQRSLRCQSNLHAQRQRHTRQLPPGSSGLHGPHNAR